MPRTVRTPEEKADSLPRLERSRRKKSSCCVQQHGGDVRYARPRSGSIGGAEPDDSHHRDPNAHQDARSSFYGGKLYGPELSTAVGCCIERGVPSGNSPASATSYTCHLGRREEVKTNFFIRQNNTYQNLDMDGQALQKLESSRLQHLVDGAQIAFSREKRNSDASRRTLVRQSQRATSMHNLLIPTKFDIPAHFAHPILRKLLLTPETARRVQSRLLPRSCGSEGRPSPRRKPALSPASLVPHHPLTGSAQSATRNLLAQLWYNSQRNVHTALTHAGQRTPKIEHSSGKMLSASIFDWFIANKSSALLRSLPNGLRLDDWAEDVDGTEYDLRCHFCGYLNGSWDERAKHIAVHFEAGWAIDQWMPPHRDRPESSSNSRQQQICRRSPKGRCLSLIQA